MSHTRANIPLVQLTLFLILALALPGCFGDDKKDEQKEQAAVPMKVIKAETRDMPYWGEFVAQVNAVETVDIRARVAGFLLEKKFVEGGRVNKDDLLFVIDPKPFQEDLKQAQSGLEYNQALLNKAHKDYERFKKLYDEGVVSRDEFESYQTQLATYKAQVRDNSAQVQNAKIQLGYTKIYSPIDGIAGAVQVDVGNLVGQGENTLLTTLSTVDPVYVNFSVNESDYLRAVRSKDINNNENRVVKLVLADGSEYDQNGSFSMVDRAIDPRTGTLGLRVSFPNPNGMLRPGQYAKVRVLIDMRKNAMAVPSRGVVDTQGMKSLFVVGADGVVKSQPVKLGFTVNDLVVVTEGLQPGDMVIVDGIRRVRPGMTVKPIVVPMESKQGTPAPATKENQPDSTKQPATDATTQEQAG